MTIRNKTWLKALLAAVMVFAMIAPNAFAAERDAHSAPAGLAAGGGGSAEGQPAKAFTVSPPVFTNYAGDPVEALTPNGFIRTSVSLKNDGEEPRQASLIAALCGANGAIENISSVDKQVAAKATETFQAGFSLPGQVEGKVVKVFVWDSLTGMQPLSNAYRFPPLDEEPQLENVALGKTYTIAQGFRDEELMAYETRTASDNGSEYELTDGKLADEKPKNYFENKNWIGFSRQVSRSVVIDLGQPKYISSVTGGFLQERAAAVDMPRYVNYSLSNDKITWHEAGRQKPSYSDSKEASRKEVTQGGINAVARYVKFEFEVGMFTFVDEITVMGRDAKTADRQAEALPVEAQPADAMPPTTEEAGGVHNLYIAYYYPVGSGNEELGKWRKDDYKSVIAHTDSDNRVSEWMFDSILFSNGGDIYNSYNTKEKWQTYLDQLFTDDLHMSALDQATAEAKAALGDQSHKTKVVISIPYPNPKPGAVWGQLDGQTVDFDIDKGEEASFEARKKAVDWYIRTAADSFAAKGYEHLELAGFYWQHEEIGFVSLNEENLLKQVSAEIHKAGKKFYWIPFFQANGTTIWKELGFDAVMMQPNYFFKSFFGPNADKGGKIDLSRLQATVGTAKRFGMGVEVEGDYQMTWNGWATDYDGQLYNGDYAARKYYAYLNEYKKANLDQVITGYYLGARTVIRDIVRSAKPFVRGAYDETAGFINGRYDPIALPETEIPLPSGDTWDRPIEIEAADGGGYTTDSAVSSSKWIKFPIKAGESWIVKLTPLEGSKFSLEARHWGQTQTKHSGFSYNKSAEEQSMLVMNPDAEDTYMMMRVYPDGKPEGKFQLTLNKPAEDGASMMNAILLPNSGVVSGAAVQAGQAIWYKISGQGSYGLTLIPDNNADFDLELYWDANSGSAQKKSANGPGIVETINYTNGYASQFLYYVKVIPKTAGSFKLYNGIAPSGTSYGNAAVLEAVYGKAYESAILNEGLAAGGQRWMKFLVGPGEEWEITLTPAAGSEVAMETRWVEGPALGYTYSWQSRETKPQKLRVKNEDAAAKYAYIRAIPQQIGGNYTIFLEKLTSP